MSTILKPIMAAWLMLCLLPAALGQSPGPSLVFPKHQNILPAGDVTLEWNTTPGAVSYRLQITEDSSFATVDFNYPTLLADSHTVSNLLVNRFYYWRVRGFNGTDTTGWSNVHSFYLLNPNQLGNLQLWVKADDGVTISNPGSPSPPYRVSAWEDQSNLNVQVTQGSISYQPEYKTEPLLDNAPVIYFHGSAAQDGFGDYFEGGQALELHTNDQTILVLFNDFIQGSSAATQNRIIQKRGHTSTVDGWCLAPRGSTWNSSVMEESGAQLVFQHQNAQPPHYDIGDGDYRIITTVWENDSADWNLYTNGRFYIHAEGSGDLRGADVANPAKPMTIGCSYNPTGPAPNLNFFFWGNIAEIIVFHTALDSANRYIAEQYLRTKYAPPVNLGRDIIRFNLCADTLDVTKPYYTSYEWYDLADSITPLSTTGTLQVTQPGTYRVVVTDIFEYTSTDTVRVDFMSVQLPGDTSICYGDTVSVSSLLGPSYDYLWSTGDTTESLSIIDSGLYFVQISYPGGCSISPEPFYVNVDYFTRDATLGPDDTFCPGNTLALVAGAGGAADYLWSTGSTDPSITIFNSDTYWVRVTDTLGCEITDTIVVTVIPGVLPTADFTFDSVCVGIPTTFANASTILSGTEFLESFLWDFDDNTSDTAANPLHQFITAGYYDVKLTATTNIGCNNSVTKTVVVFASPTVDYTTTLDSAGCINYSYSFFDNSFTTTPPDLVSYMTWDFGDGTDSVTQQNPTHTYTATGTYDIVLEIETDFGCVSSDTATVILLDGILDPDAFSIYYPPANTVTSDDSITFMWNYSANTRYYLFQLATAADFAQNSIVLQERADTTFYTVPDILPGIYYWRVIAVNLCGVQVNSDRAYKLTVFGTGLFDGMQLWLMADSGVIADPGGGISDWKDLSGNNNHVQQTIALQRPTLDSNVINNKPAVYFYNQGSQFLEGGNRLNLGSNDQSLFIVFNSKNLTGDQYRIIQKRGTPNSGFDYAPGWCLAGRGPRLTPSVIERDATDKISFNAFTDYGLIDECFRFITTVWDNSEGNWKLYINGDLRENPTNSSMANKSYTTNKYFSLGCAWNTDGNSQFFHGNIAEVIIFDKAVDDNQRKIVEEYLRQKYYPLPNIGADVELSYGFCTDVPLGVSECVGCFKQCEYLWSTGETTASIIAPGQGEYWVEVTDPFNVITRDTVIVKGGFNTVSFEDEITLCMGESLTWDTKLTADGYEFLWSPTNTTDSFLVITEPGDYSVYVVDTNAPPCDYQSNTVRIVIDSFEVLATLGPDTQSLCSGNRIAIVEGGETARQYLWAPGGSTEAELTITVTGDYSITAANTHGCIMDDTVHVDIRGDAPNANFSFNRTCLNDTTFFADSSEAALGFNIVERIWDFDDSGSTDSVANPWRLFDNVDTFDVSLWVIDDNDCYQEITRPVHVLQLPTPMFTNEVNQCANDGVLFFDSSSAAPGQTLTNWLWDFGDGNTGTMPDAVNIFATGGKYPVSLRVTTDSMCVNTIYDTIEIHPEFVVAIESEGYCFGAPTQFCDASPAFSTISWYWDFNHTSTTGFSTEECPQWEYFTPGTYIVTLTAKNAVGCITTAYDTISITNKPTVDFQNPPICLGAVYRFIETTTIDPADSITGYKWKFGVTPEDSSTLRMPTYLYDSIGEYNVTLTVSTRNGCDNSAVKPVNVLGRPVAAFTRQPEYGAAPLTVTFTNLSQNATHYLWIFGDGDSSTEVNPVHTYLYDGDYNPMLIAYNVAGCSDTTTSTMFVRVLYFDLSLDNIIVTKINGHCYPMRFELDANITDKSTLPVTSFDMTTTVLNNGTGLNHWVGTFNNRQLVYHWPTTEFANGCENVVVCMEVTNPNGYEDVNPEDNKRCYSMNGEWTIIGPNPNPTGDFVNLTLVAPSSGTLRISNYNVIGQRLGDWPAQQIDKDITMQLLFDVSLLPQGVYLLKVQFNEETKIIKYLKTAE